MDNMNDWCIRNHGQSGLTEQVLKSTKTVQQVEQQLMDYLIKEHKLQKDLGILAGNSIHQDRMFLIKEFPRLIDYLHYRQIDVTSIYEIGKRQNPELMSRRPMKKHAHTAKADILESIEELKWYCDNFFIKPKNDDAKHDDTKKDNVK